jgi:hypothetical protein
LILLLLEREITKCCLLTVQRVRHTFLSTRVLLQVASATTLGDRLKEIKHKPEEREPSKGLQRSVGEPINTMKINLGTPLHIYACAPLTATICISESENGISESKNGISEFFDVAGGSLLTHNLSLRIIILYYYPQP